MARKLADEDEALPEADSEAKRKKAKATTSIITTAKSTALRGDLKKDKTLCFRTLQHHKRRQTSVKKTTDVTYDKERQAISIFPSITRNSITSCKATKSCIVVTHGGELRKAYRRTTYRTGTKCRKAVRAKGRD
jgi:hypothetical protein